MRTSQKACEADTAHGPLAGDRLLVTAAGCGWVIQGGCMNLTHAVATAVVVTAPTVCEELVVEELVSQTAEQFQPGTCICWVDVYGD